MSTWPRNRKCHCGYLSIRLLFYSIFVSLSNVSQQIRIGTKKWQWSLAHALLDFRCILLMFNFYILHRVLHSIDRVEIPLTQDFVTFYSVAFILFILTGCFMDNVCHDPGYKFTKDCQEIQCRGGMMGFQVVKEGMRGIFLFLGNIDWFNSTMQWIECRLYLEIHVHLLFLLV